MKKLSLILALVLVLGLLAGCGESAPTAQDYTLESGITLTAESGMEEKVQAPFTTTLQGKNSMVTFLEERKDMLTPGLTLEGYGDILMKFNGLTDPFTLDPNGSYANSYTKEADGQTFFYYLTVKETGSSFWMVQMVCLESQKDTYEPLFSQWLATVQLPESEGGLDAEFAEKEYQLDCGLTITMPEDMGNTNMDGYDAFYTNNLVSFLLMLEEKPEGWTLEDYAAAVAQSNGEEAMPADEFGNPAMTFVYENQGITYHYYVTVHEFSDCFALCQFFCMDGAMDVYGDHMASWSDSLSE